MRSLGGQRGAELSLMLSVLLLLAQSAALAHVFEHDTGAPQSQSCAFCVAASQLDSPCVDNPAAVDMHWYRPRLTSPDFPEPESTHAIGARQRGPPRSI